MAVNETLYKRLRDAGFSHSAALIFSDSESEDFSGGLLDPDVEPAPGFLVIENGAEVPEGTLEGTVIFEKE